MTSISEWYNNLNKIQFFGAIVLLLIAFAFRAHVVRSCLSLVKKGFVVPQLWLTDFEKLLVKPLAWDVFFLCFYLAIYLLNWSDESIVAFGLLMAAGIPIVWTVHRLFQFITIVTIRYKGWDKSASVDDSSRVVIVTEGITLIQFLVILVVVYIIYLKQLADSSKIVVVLMISLELLFVLSSHTWIKNIVGGLVLLAEEPFVAGTSVRLAGQEGVVEAISLRYVTLRRHDKAVAHIPNGTLVESLLCVLDPRLQRECTIWMHLDHETSSTAIRHFIQQADLLLRTVFEDTGRKKFDFRSTARKSDTFSKLLSERGPSTISNRSTKEKTSEEQQCFWVSLEGVFHVKVVYFTKYRDYHVLVKEKSELILQLTELMQSLKLKLHDQIEIDSSIGLEPSNLEQLSEEQTMGEASAEGTLRRRSDRVTR